MQISKDKIVSIEYRLTDDDQNVIDESQPDQPLAYLHGHGRIVPGLENALDGKQSGEEVSVKVPPEEGYGEHHAALKQEVPSSQFQGVDDLQVGMQFTAQTGQGPITVRVTNIDGETVTVDGNHPLAGQNLNFDVKIAEVREATEEELAQAAQPQPDQ